jgi:hypothetical protein
MMFTDLMNSLARFDPIRDVSGRLVSTVTLKEEAWCMSYCTLLDHLHSCLTPELSLLRDTSLRDVTCMEIVINSYS